MDEACGPVQMYLECDRALEHYEKQHQDIQRHTLLYRRNTSVNEHNNTLKKIHAYLQTSDAKLFAGSHLRFEEFLSGDILEAADVARGKESGLLHRIVLALIWTKLYLLDKMVQEDIFQLVGPMRREKVEFIYEICENEVGSVQRSRNKCLKAYTKCIDMSREDLKQDLVAAEYAKDKRLNKFELETDMRVKSKVESSLDEAWNQHLKQLPQLQSFINRENASIQRWKGKAEFLRLVLNNGIQYVAMEMARKNVEREQCNSSLETLSKEQEDTEPSEPDANEEQSQAYVEDTVSESSTLTLADKLDRTYTSSSRKSRRSTASTVGLASTSMHKASSPLRILIPQLDSPKTLCSPTDAENKPLPLASESAEEQPDPSASASTPLQEKPLNITTNQTNSPGEDYRFGHNKPPTPTVRPTSVDKDLWRRPFAGIDRYAQGLFAKSPTTGPGAQKER